MSTPSFQLAPYAMDDAHSRGRKYGDSTLQPYRKEYQRDRDRIIHSAAFRRLEYKTQVFIYTEGDYYRTRLTHTIETAQIARTIARALSLNEDLVEAIALAHDLGHTPFGHAGEDTLNDLMKSHGGFNHNLQTLRIVEILEKRYPDFRGLNLTWEVREGIAKHMTTYDTSIAHKIQEYEPRKQATLEAQVVDLADEIAYTNHDLDDGITSQLLEEDDLAPLALWQEINQGIEQMYGTVSPKVKKYQRIRLLISCLVDDLIAQSQKNIAASNIQTVTDVRGAGKKLISFSKTMLGTITPLRQLLWDKFYHHYRIVRMAEKARRLLTELFGLYIEKPDALPREFQKYIATDEDRYTIVCDYIAGMTDRYALDEHKKLFDRYEKV